MKDCCITYQIKKCVYIVKKCVCMCVYIYVCVYSKKACVYIYMCVCVCGGGGGGCLDKYIIVATWPP